ncbi:long-chain fatty acid--CoA ligase [Corynebacterium sp. 320]|uniref:AMP-dependent synthetase/ligase n=1 Tax=Corynebacterium TaxID=1716 RepID=UPI00125CA893|nr:MULTISPECIES: long-chain fatty acid--CoA ligase [Corynebacterium]KAB1502409.1 long-chain fatty acid--CoA ligase [Corynebacterium sp. 320]KAB1551370.1 long-chain fatty acid--CoA ligase [Corynebacterium sp. 321]KAB1551801.1 long-chain fatty acid--CoA ligase [Corynebacterium sp. 319]KAB3526016.1 long-chain fatty acid--CoA ligase [Corynebacterium sp. 250]KAB3538796.1 long-chain fatty acid--CoA ligase [Corynebacterium sp. 366]
MSTYTTDALYTVGDAESCLTAVRDRVDEFGSDTLFSRPVGYDWEDVSIAQFLDEVYSVARGLIALGIEKGDRVVIMSETRYEWTLVDYAVAAAGAISVPIYSSSSTSQCEWIVGNSGSRIAFGENDEYCGRLNTFLNKGERVDNNASLEHVFNINAGGIDDVIAKGKEAGITQDQVEERIAATKSSDVATIVYTSGTTGRPKGCRLTNSNLLSEVRGLHTHPIGAALEPGVTSLTFLPLAHVLARAVSNLFIVAGAQQTHWSDMGTIVNEFQRSEPNVILAVPRIFEKVHAGVKHKATDGGGPKAKIFLRAEETAIEYSRALDTDKGPSLGLKARKAVFDKLVYGKIRAALGGELAYCISGGSALNAELMHFFRGAGVYIYEGYGLTESTAAVAVNFEPNNIIGTVGRPVGGNTIRIAEDGEIELKGSVIFDGYWNNEEATKEAFTEDGFYRTGDLGELLPSGHLKITGRKKEIIVTAGGKNVSPGPMEDILRAAPLISQAMVVGDDQKFVGALISLDEDAVKAWKSEHNIPEHTSIRELAKNSNLRSEIQDAVNKANLSVSHTEGIKKFRIVARDFSEEKGEVTPSMKLKRFAISENFADDIARIYNG